MAPHQLPPALPRILPPWSTFAASALPPVVAVQTIDGYEWSEITQSWIRSTLANGVPVVHAVLTNYGFRPFSGRVNARLGNMPLKPAAGQHSQSSNVLVEQLAHDAQVSIRFDLDGALPAGTYDLVTQVQTEILVVYPKPHRIWVSASPAGHDTLTVYVPDL